MKSPISERTLENFICKYPEYTFWEGTEIIGHQVHLRYGVLDILAWDSQSVLVVELKTEYLKEKHIGQVLRYTCDVEAHLRKYGAFTDTPNGVPLRLWNAYFNLTGRNWEPVMPVLVGRGIDDKTMAAATGGNIYVMIWKYNSQKNLLTFEHLREPGWPSDNPNWLAILARKLTVACMEETKEIKRERVEDVITPDDSSVHLGE